jgi:hypothetical protein
VPVGERLGVRALGVVAGRHVDFAVGPEVHGATVVVRGRMRVERYEVLAGPDRLVARRGEAAEPVGAANAPVHVDPLVRGELGVHGDAERPLLRRHIDSERGERLGDQRAVG